MDAKKIFNAVLIGFGVAKSLATGKVAKSLDKVEEGVQIAKAIAKLVKPKSEKK